MDIDYKKISQKLKIGLSTLYQWEKTRPELYEFIVNNSVIQKESEIEKIYNQLTEEEKEMYLSEMKAIVIRRKLKK